MRLFAIFRGILRDALDADGKKIVNLGSPTQDGDAANKAYVDSSTGAVLDDTVTETSSNGVKSSGIWSWVKSLLPSWLTPTREEPPTQAAVAAKYTKPSGGIPATDMTQAVKTSLALVPTAAKQTSWDNKQDAIIGLTAALVSWLSQFKGTDTATTLASVLSAIGGKLDKQRGAGSIDWNEDDGYLQIINAILNFSGQGSGIMIGANMMVGGEWLLTSMLKIFEKIQLQFGARLTFIDACGNEVELEDLIKRVASLAPEYSTSSAYSVGQYVFHNGNIYRCTTAIALPGEAWTPAHWSSEQKLDDFFKEYNTLLVGTIDARLPYPINTDGTIKDRAVNVVTSGAFVIPEGFKDLLIRYTGVPTSLTFSGTDASIADYGDDLPTETGDYLITVTRTNAAECYIRIIKLEARA